MKEKASEERRGVKATLALEASPSLLITAPRARRDLLIFAPSLRVFPVALVLFCLSEPERRRTGHQVKGEKG
jgi:hypothetical protein